MVLERLGPNAEGGVQGGKKHLLIVSRKASLVSAAGSLPSKFEDVKV